MFRKGRTLRSVGNAGWIEPFVQFYPILTDPADCGSVILSYKDTNLLTKKEDLKKAGIKRFRIYAG